MSGRPALLIAVLALSGAARAAEPVDFAHDVLPILKARCAKCHTNGKYEGDLSLDTRESLLRSEVVVPGRSDESTLIERVAADDPDLRMPPEGDPLTAEQIAVLRTWIDQKLPWQEGFSFKSAFEREVLRPLSRPELPPAHNGRSHSIDRLVDAYAAQNGASLTGLVDDATFLRRIYLDVIGLPPTPEELDAFRADPASDKRERLARELLSRDRQYAEHWLTFWNDLLRNDYAGTGYIDEGRRQITGWLYRSLLENKPYDQFVRELISPTPESEGFIKGIKWRGRINASQTPEVQFAQNVSQVMLGINLKCASCHDSFIDGWKLADAYGMAAIVSEQPLEIHRCDKPTGETAQAGFLFPELGTIDPALAREERLGRVAELITAKENGRVPRTIVNRIWQRLMGRGLVEPVDVMASQPWSRELLDFLAADLVEHEYDLKRTIELIVTSQTYQSEPVVLHEEPLPGEFVFRGPIPRRMTAEQFLDAIWRITGTAPEKPAADFGDRGSEPVRAALVNADALMRSLGRPNREQVVTTRPDDLTTLQALDLSNGEILADLLARGAANLRQQHPDWTAEEAADWLFRAALCRPPTDEESMLARDIVGMPPTDEGLTDLLWMIFMLPEFQLVR